MTDVEETQIGKVFAYWDTDDHSAHTEFVAEWRGHFPQFRIVGDAEALPLIEQHFPEYVKLYKAIRIPAARSDIARCVLLHAYGGVYVDCHCGVRDIADLRAEIARLSDVDLIVLNREKPVSEWQRDENLVINGMLFARPSLPVMLEACAAALENLAAYRQKQLASGTPNAVPYDIWSMTGPWVLTSLLFDAARCNRVLRREFEGRVRVIPEATAPIRRLMHVKTRISSLHWSHRQANEPLFDF